MAVYQTDSEKVVLVQNSLSGSKRLIRFKNNLQNDNSEYRSFQRLEYAVIGGKHLLETFYEVQANANSSEECLVTIKVVDR